MQCPFLKQTHVKFCEKAAYRKMIRQDGAEADRCSSPAFRACAIYQDSSNGGPPCPHFRQSLVQYCSAASVTKFVPPGESAASRCSNGGFRHCEIYAEHEAAANGGLAWPGGAVFGDTAPEERWIDGIRVPNWLYYSPNHMWLELSEDGACHVGIDGLLARALGSVDAVSFLGGEGSEHPSVVLRVGCADLQLAFPCPIQAAEWNRYLRADPRKITAQPYSSGWLLRGATPADAIDARLIRGTQAAQWIESEFQAFSRASEGVGLLDRAPREDALALFDRFFSPYRKWNL